MQHLNAKLLSMDGKSSILVFMLEFSEITTMYNFYEEVKHFRTFFEHSTARQKKKQKKLKRRCYRVS